MELFPRPPRGTIILSRGGDLVIDFRNNISGVLTNYASGVTVTLFIEPSLSISASISGYSAVCKVESNVADNIPRGTPWRVVVSYPTIPTTEVVAMNGKTSRSD